mgnify:CR=1 FL=1
MSKIVINGVDGNFGSLVAKYALELMNKEDLVFTAQFDQNENCGYVAQLLNFFNNNTTFRLSG